MTEMEFVNQALNLKDKMIGVKTAMGNLRRLFEFASNKLRGKNEAEARKLFSLYWHQHNHEFRVFRNLSELEIYKVIQKRITLTNKVNQLFQMGAKLTRLTELLDNWIGKGKAVYSTLELCGSVQDEIKRASTTDVRGMIAEMKRGKDQMVQVFGQARQLAVLMGVPFVSDYISMNASIFIELGKLCDKVAVYSLKIVEETEKTLGAKGVWMSTINDDNSWWNGTKRISDMNKRQ